MKKLFCLLLCISFLLTGCSKQTVVENTESNEDDFIYTNYNSNMNWMVHRKISNLTDQDLMYYSIKQNLIIQVEKLIIEDSVFNGTSFNKKDIKLVNYLNNTGNKDSEIYKFYKAMSAGENSISDFVFNYIKILYPEYNAKDSESFFTEYYEKYFSGINSIENNQFLSKECKDFLSSFAIDDNGWMTYEYKHKFVNHIENFKQFVPKDAIIDKNQKYVLTYHFEDDKKKIYSITQNLYTGEVILINTKINISDISSLKSFDFSQFEEVENEETETEEEIDTIEERNNENNIYYNKGSDEKDQYQINEEIMNRFNENFLIYIDSAYVYELNTIKLIEDGYIWEESDDTKYKQMLIKKDYTGKKHVIYIKQ